MADPLAKRGVLPLVRLGLEHGNKGGIASGRHSASDSSRRKRSDLWHAYHVVYTIQESETYLCNALCTKENADDDLAALRNAFRLGRGTLPESVVWTSQAVLPLHLVMVFVLARQSKHLVGARLMVGQGNVLDLPCLVDDSKKVNETFLGNVGHNSQGKENDRGSGRACDTMSENGTSLCTAAHSAKEYALVISPSGFCDDLVLCG